MSEDAIRAALGALKRDVPPRWSVEDLESVIAEASLAHADELAADDRRIVVEAELDMPLAPLERLSRLLYWRNGVDTAIAFLIDRPPTTGHIGEWLAAQIFDIQLFESAVHASSDGVFRSGPLAGRTVNIKAYGKLEGILDLAKVAPPDYYLVLAGPQSRAASSRGGIRPFVVDSVFLFDAELLHTTLTERGVQIGTASSVLRTDWQGAEIYPAENSQLLPLSLGQRTALALFSGPAIG